MYTDRAQNLMSSPFCEAMRDISASMKKVYAEKHTTTKPSDQIKQLTKTHPATTRATATTATRLL